MPADGAAARRRRFENLTLPLQDLLYYSALALTRQDADALDLAQETYLRAWRAFHTYRDDLNLRGWMLTILRNAYVDSCRRKRVEPALAELTAETAPQAPAAAPAARLDDALPDDVVRALRALSPSHQMLVLLADVERFAYREIADVLGCPIGSVMSGLHNARTKLRALLTPVPAATRPPG